MTNPIENTPSPIVFTLDSLKPENGMLVYVDFDGQEIPKEFYSYWAGLNLSQIATIIYGMASDESISIDQRVMLFKGLFAKATEEKIEGDRAGT